MSDDQQPSFFGGLPPRGARSTALSPQQAPREVRHEPAQDTPTRNTLALVAFIGSFFIALVGIICGHIALKQIKRSGQDGRRLALAGVLIGYAGVVIWTVVLAVVLVHIANTEATAAQAATALQKSVTESHVAESAKAAEVIAVGGGAVEGHDVSVELCTAVNAFATLGAGDVATQEISPEQLAALEGLAAIESPNRAGYRGYFDYRKNPASVPSIADAQQLSTDFNNAVQEDVATCL